MEDLEDAKVTALPTFNRLQGIRLERIEDFVNVQLKETLQMTPVNGKLKIVSPVSKVAPGPGSAVTVHTSADHRLYRYDMVTFEGVKGFGYDKLLNGSTYSVAKVGSPDTFDIDVHERHAEANPGSFREGFGGTVRAPVNMYKASPEVVIPQTTTEERLVKVTDDDVLATLRWAVVNPEGVLTLRGRASLPDAHGRPRPLEAGLAVHGRLSPQGCFRRSYWSLRDDRARLWRTTAEAHGRAQMVAEALTDGDGSPRDLGELEDRLWGLGPVQVGDTLVLRRGVSYAELQDDGDVDDFISHWWGEETTEFLATLQRHEEDVASKAGPGVRRPRGQRRKYVCTLCNRQHRVDELGIPTWDRWDELIFFVVLKHVSSAGGTVIVTLDPSATPLRRIWCIFEAWVCASGNIPYSLYTADGGLQQCLTSIDSKVSKRALSLQDKVTQMDLREAQTSVEDDRKNILHLIEKSEGGIDRVEYIVKRSILNTQEIMTSLQRVRDPFTGKQFKMLGESCDIAPIRVYRKKLGLYRIFQRPCSHKSSISIEDLYTKLRTTSPRIVVVGPGGAGKTVLAVQLMHLAHSVATSDSGHLQRMKTSVCVQVGQFYRLAHKWSRGRTYQGFIRPGTRVQPTEPKDPLELYLEERFGQRAAVELIEPPRSGSSGILLVLDAFDEADDVFDILKWLRAWTKLRLEAGWEDQIVITTRGDVLRFEVIHLLHWLGFKSYKLAALQQGDAVELVERISGLGAARKLFAKFASGLYDRPLMAVLIAHYFRHYSKLGGSSEIGGDSVIPHERSVGSDPEGGDGTRTIGPIGSVNEAELLRFMRERFVARADGLTGLGTAATNRVLLRLAWRAAMAMTPAGNYTRARSRLLGLTDVEEACEPEDASGQAARRLYEGVRHGKMHVLQPVTDGHSIDFAHLVVQDYCAACHLFHGPGDEEPFKKAWRSLGTGRTARGDGLSSIREFLCILIASREARDDGNCIPRHDEDCSLSHCSWLQLAALTGSYPAVREALEVSEAEGRDKLEVGVAIGRAYLVKCHHLVRRRRVLTILAKAATCTDIGVAGGFTIGYVVEPFPHPFWLLFAAWVLLVRGQGWDAVNWGGAVQAAIPAAGGLLSLCLNLETLTMPLVPFFGYCWVLLVWAVQRWQNFVRLPLVVVCGVALYGFVRVIQAIIGSPFHSLGVWRLQPGTKLETAGAPYQSFWLRALHPRAPRCAQLLLAAANVVAIVLLAILCLSHLLGKPWY